MSMTIDMLLGVDEEDAMKLLNVDVFVRVDEEDEMMSCEDFPRP